MTKESYNSDWTLQGLEFYKKGQYEKAIRCFDKIIQSDAYSGYAYYWRAKCYESLLREEMGERWEQLGLPLEALNSTWWKQNWFSPSDSRLMEAVRSYEKAIELLPLEKDVLKQALDFAFKAQVVGKDVEYRLFDKWLENHPDDVSAWAEKGGWALTYDDNLVAIESHNKAIDLIKSFYDLEEWKYDVGEEDKLMVIKNPDAMLENHRSALENALLGNFSSYCWGLENYAGMLKYFWELYYLTGNEYEIVNSLTTIILHTEDKGRAAKKIEELKQKTGLTEEQYERKNYQNLLIDYSNNILKSFLKERLKREYGKSWWEKGVPQYLKEKSSDRKNIHEHKHPDQEKQHPFSYLDISDYNKIINETANWNRIFERYFSDNVFIRNLIGDLADYRNIIKHDGRLLGDTEIKELEVILYKIEKCIK